MSSLIMFRLWLASVADRPRQDRGASLVEYVLVLSFIAVVCIVGVTQLGIAVDASYANSSNNIIASN
ncbi:MAG: hypothetical protein EXQ71_00390 [Acidimicrobiia bacterium]|nr:hypothetical protein [Acidimicrobiia bacterium]